jgi:hypothetical protein
MSTGPLSKVRPRMRNLHRALLAGSLGFAASFVAGCGSGAGLLSGNQASTLQNQLSQVSSALSAGHCAQVRSATQSLVGEVASLPTSVNENLRQALGQEASQVSTLSVQECHPPAATTPKTTTTPPPTTTTTTPTTTTTTPTTTTTTPTTTTTTPATTTTTPGTTTTGSSGGGGLGGGAGGGGNGNGNG